MQVVVKPVSGLLWENAQMQTNDAVLLSYTKLMYTLNSILVLTAKKINNNQTACAVVLLQQKNQGQICVWTSFILARLAETGRREPGLEREHRQLKLIGLVTRVSTAARMEAIYSTNCPSPQFTTVCVCVCVCLSVCVSLQWDSGKSDSCFLPMNHWRQDARQTQSGLFSVLITI